MKWLFKNFMKKQTFMYIFGNILTISGALLSRIWPVAATGKIIDAVVVQNDGEEAVKLLILSITLYVIGRIMGYISVIIVGTTTDAMCNKLRKVMHNKLYYLDHNYFENTTVGELNVLLGKDVVNIYRFVSYDIKQGTHEFLTALIALIYCATINWQMSLSLLLFMPLFMYFTFSYAKKTDKLYKIEREKSAILDSYIQENIEGNRLIRNLGTEEKEIKKFKSLNEDYIDYKIKISYKMFNHIEIIKFLSYFMWVVMIFLGGIFIIKGSLSLGEFVIFNSYINQISKPMYSLVDYMNDFQYFKISLDKIRNLLKLEPKQKDNGIKKLRTNRYYKI